MNRVGVFLLSIVALCGCNPSTHLKPIPVIYGPGRLDLSSMTPETRHTNTVQVFYATNRKPEGPADHRDYGNDVDSSLHLGVSTIQIGDKGTSWDDIGRASTRDGDDPTFTLIEASDFPDSAAFFDAINQQLAMTPNHEVTIYVHGFFTRFNVAVELLGKMLHFGARRGVVVCFSWPARQNVFVYGGDVDRGIASAHYLADLIVEIAANTTAENINLLAYSAGAPCATDALLELRKRHQDQTPEQLARSLRIGNIIYASSDLDTATFAREQIVQLKQLAQRIVIYISANDSVLGMASMMYGASRVGHPDVTKFTKEEQEAVAKDPQIQVVDVTDVPGPQGFGGFGGHYYWYSNDWVMTDVLVDFRWQLSPEQRGLYHKPGMSRWYFPKDYPEKVTAAVKQQLMLPATAPTNPVEASSTAPTTTSSTATEPASPSSSSSRPAD
jgi:esterase/lipase superfamily enzyme